MTARVSARVHTDFRTIEKTKELYKASVIQFRHLESQKAICIVLFSCHRYIPVPSEVKVGSSPQYSL